jgi:hypothetical protein
MTATNAATAQAPDMRWRYWPLLALILAGPATGQPAVPAATPPLFRTVIDADLQALPQPTLQWLAAIDVNLRTRLLNDLAELGERERQTYLAIVADEPLEIQQRVLFLLGGDDLKRMGENRFNELPAMLALLKAMAPGTDYDFDDPFKNCEPLKAPGTPAGALDNCMAAAFWLQSYEPAPAGPGMVPAPRGTAPWQAQLVSAGASARGKLAVRTAQLASLGFTEASVRSYRQSIMRRPAPVPEPFEVLHVCGASNIGGGWILTAAHCIGNWQGRNAAFFDGRRIMIGSRKISRGGQTWRIDAVVRHGNYRAARIGDDIALIRLAPGPVGAPVEPFTPIALPTAREPIPAVGTALQVTGWGVTGVTSDGGDDRDSEGELQRYSEVLRVGTITLMTQAACNKHPEFRYRRLLIGEGQLCAGSDDGVDACKGDSGGPLVWRPEGRAPQLVGVVSHGPGCGLPKTPAAYADVRFYAGWIAAARAQAQTGKIIDFVPGQCRNDGVDVPCAREVARP